MAHREIRDDERCGMNTFLGVHVWEFSQKAESGEVKTSVECKACRVQPPAQMRWRLVDDFRRTVDAQKASDSLKQAHKEATGLGKRRA
jgi:nitrogen fixation protein FixH